MSYHDWVMVPKAYQAKLTEATGLQVILEPSTVKPERFHVRLSPLPHPVVVGNGLVGMRLRASVHAEIPPTDRGISDSLDVSLRLAQWFDGEQGGIQIGTADAPCWAIAYHTQIREDDDAFTDLVEDQSYSYDEHWLVQINFNYEAAKVAVTKGA